MLQNLVTLKWCRYYNIDVLWNLLYGFPGEKEEDYLRELEILKLISHFQPPATCSRIWLERFAPYFFERENFPIHSIRPESSYAYVYPPHVSLEKIAYTFDYEMSDTVPESIHDEKKDWINRWIRKWNTRHPDVLIFRSVNSKLFIRDQRKMLKRKKGHPKDYKYFGTRALVYELCSNTYRTVSQVQEELEKRKVQKCSEEAIRLMLDSFCDYGLMVCEDGKYFALALPEPLTSTWSFNLHGIRV